jgi:nitrite reductase (NADH) small subunit/3-phenylpropionate/trans-cinnamate dioxygenase ferredoxin subunit
MDRWTEVAKLSQLKQDRGRVVELRGRLIALFRRGEAVHAIDDACPHMGGPLSEGGLFDQCVMCPWHGWRFDVVTGEWIDAHQPNAVRCYAVKVEDDVVSINADW